MLHNFSCHFLRGGDTSKRIRIETTQLTNGRAFGAVHALAMQDGKPILTMTASLQTAEPGHDHQPSGGLRAEWRRPHELLPLSEHMRPLLSRLPDKMRALYAEGAPIEMRPAEFVSPFDRAPREPRRAIWLRCAGGPLPDDHATHQRLLTYASDWALLETAVFPHNDALWGSRTRAASLSHSMYFHRPFRADEWLCHVMYSPSASGARGFTLGEVWSESGQLVASTAQEGLIRPNGWSGSMLGREEAASSAAAASGLATENGQS